MLHLKGKIHRKILATLKFKILQKYNKLYFKFKR